MVQAPLGNEKKEISEELCCVDTTDSGMDVSNSRAHFFTKIKEQYDFIKVSRIQRDKFIVL